MTEQQNPDSVHDKTDEGASSKDSRIAVVLVVFSILSSLIIYVTSIRLARILGPEAYGEYIVALVAVLTLANLSEWAAGKHGLRILPAFAIKGEWSLFAGYLRFSFLLVFVTSVGLAIGFASVEGFHDGEFGDYALGVGMIFLPVVALVGIGVDFVMANRASIAGSFVARILVPSTTLILVLVCPFLIKGFNESAAIVCFGMGSVVGLFAVAYLMQRTTPRDVFKAKPNYRLSDWFQSLIVLVGLVFLLSLIFKISILILEVLPIEVADVGRFAAALETASMILLMSKSTDKYFQPQIAEIIESEDWGRAVKMRSRRFALMTGTCLAYLAIIVIFGKLILSLYGPGFVEAYPALILTTIGTCAWTVFSLAPAYLRFVGRSSVIYVISAISAAIIVGLTFWLGNILGPTGAAIAFLAGMLTMVISLRVVAGRHFQRASGMNFYSSPNE